MRRIFALGSLLLFLIFCTDQTPVFASAPQGLARKVRVTVETSRKEDLMDAIQRAFEREGYRLSGRSDVEIVVERKLSSSLRWELWSQLRHYGDGGDALSWRLRDPVERISLWVIRQTTRTIQIEAFRILCANPDTAAELAVMDENQKRAEALRQMLEEIEKDMEDL